MRRGLAHTLVGLGLPVLLLACGQRPAAGTSADSPDGTDVPWTYTAPAGKVAPLNLAPGFGPTRLTFGLVVSARNGYGPVEINTSNGERAAGDGRTLTLNGRTYSTGFGTHADSELRFTLSGATVPGCTHLTSDIGVDDEVGNRGSVVFQVFVDGTKTYDSGKMTGASATRHLDVNIGGAGEVRLVVTDAGDGRAYDHADWANPSLSCVAEPPVRLTLDQNEVVAYHMQRVPLRATLSPGSVRGPVDLRLESADGSNPEVLQTTRIDVAGAGPVTQDVFIATPNISSQEFIGSGEPQSYRLIASANGRDLAGADLRVLVRPLSIQTRYSPSRFVTPPRETVPLTLALDISPPPTLPLSFSLELRGVKDSGLGQGTARLVTPGTVYDVRGTHNLFPVNVSPETAVLGADKTAGVDFFTTVRFTGGDFGPYLKGGLGSALLPVFTWVPLLPNTCERVGADPLTTCV